MSLFRNFVLQRLERVAASRPPDKVIGGPGDPYMKRWHIVPRNRFCNVYFHHFLRSDDDRALHDHPWANVSWLLKGEYDEVLRDDVMNGCRTIFQRRRRAGYVVFRRATSKHRVALLMDPLGGFVTLPNHDHRFAELPVRTLFITGPEVREWGFYCPKGWSHHKEYQDPLHPGQVGRGCE